MTLRQIREERNLTCEQVCHKLQCSNSYVSKIESTLGGRAINFILIKKLSDIYDRSITDIVYACNQIKKIEELLYLDKVENFQNLKQLRESRGITQTEASSSLGINYSTLYRVETSKRKPNSKNIFNMHRYYQTSCETIMGICLTQFKNIL